MSLRIGRAIDATAIEVVAGAGIPEIVKVEIRQEDRGRIARLHPAELMSASVGAREAGDRVNVVRRNCAAQIRYYGPHASDGRWRTEGSDRRYIHEPSEVDAL